MPANIATRVRAAMSAAHFIGIGRGAARRAEEDTNDEDDEDKKAAAADDQTEQDRDNGDSKKSRSATRAEEEDEDDKDDKDDKKAKKAKRAKGDKDDDADPDEDAGAEEDDDDEEEMRGKSAAASARRRERARCAAIMGDKAAAKNVELAASLAFNTSMTRNEALAVLKSTPAASTGNAARGNRNPNLGPGGGSEPTSQQSTAASWDKVIAKKFKK